MKFSLLFFTAIAFVLLVSSCSDDPVSSTGTHATPEYHGELLSLDAFFERVTGTGADDLYAFGTMLLHYNGSKWNPVSLPDNVSGFHTGIAFADGQMAVTDGYRTFLRKNETWLDITNFERRAVELWGTSSMDIYGLGYEGMSHFDGDSWSPVVLPGAVDYPFPMSGRSSTDLVAGGHNGAIYRFDGSEWSTTLVDSTAYFTSLAMTQSGRLFAADYGRIVEITGSTSQVIQEEELANAYLCADGEYLYAAGSIRFHEYADPQFVIERYEDNSWHEIVREKGKPRALWAGNGNLLAAGDNNMIWRGGVQGGIVETVYPRRNYVNCAINIDDAIFAAGEGAYRYENGAWTDLNKEYVSRNQAFAIAGRSRRDIYAVGERMVMHYDGEQWSWINAGFDVWLEAAWMDPSGDLLTAGGPTIFRKHGDEWFEEGVPGDPRYVFAMWGDEHAVFAVGSDGLIAVRKNGPWRSMASGTSSDLYTVWGFDATHVYAAGSNNNELCSFDGVAWQPVAITSVDLEEFRRLWGNSPSDLWAAAYDGTVAHYDGRGWTEMEHLLPSGIRALCGNTRETLVIGRYGIISYHR